MCPSALFECRKVGDEVLVLGNKKSRGRLLLFQMLQ